MYMYYSPQNMTLIYPPFQVASVYIALLPGVCFSSEPEQITQS